MKIRNTMSMDEYIATSMGIKNQFTFVEIHI